ncbi:MAG: hypothetical protein AAGD25_28115 [Cyanobacteria bacterium P01_F01_bin.150]
MVSVKPVLTWSVHLTMFEPIAPRHSPRRLHVQASLDQHGSGSASVALYFWSASLVCTVSTALGFHFESGQRYVTYKTFG